MPSVREPKPNWAEVPADVRQALSGLLGASVKDATVMYGGYSASATFSLFLEDGRRAFIKGSSRDSPAFVQDAMRQEAKVYAELAFCRDFAPRQFGQIQQNGWHFLVMEDLSDATKVPPWSTKTLEATLRRAAELHARAGAALQIV